MGADITVWPTLAQQLYKAEGSYFCVAYCCWTLQSRDGGIHGVEAFHFTWKAVQDNCEHWEGGSSEFLGHWQDHSHWLHTLWCDCDCAVADQVTLQNLNEAIQCWRPGLPVLLLHDNGRLYSVQAITVLLNTWHWECVPHPPYSTHFVPTDFHMWKIGENISKVGSLRLILPTKMRSRSGFESRISPYTASAWNLSSCSMTNAWRSLVALWKN